ncbi:MAG: sigma-70 family polymerase sigma factor [Bacteroidetes bacterium]|jgi:RNA polymerase sigma-70 factor (ECF subfamily)|nr:sigma-70 family polymerase sigma factor [Bacteroidota bacterium]
MPTEQEQIKAAKSDSRAFEPLYNKYYENIIKFVYKRVEDIDNCREITAIVFSKALNNIKKHNDLGFPFSSWLYRIAINEITQFYRDKTKMRIISLSEKGIKNMAEESGEHQAELISVLKKALMYLDEDELNLIELRYFEERPFAEVGQILGITENNAKVKTYRVIDKLKEIYKKIS